MKYGIRLTLAAAAATLACNAMALDFTDGYTRLGPVFSGAQPLSAGSQAYGHYSLGGAGQMYRLGNEGDFYGEVLLSQTGSVNGQTFKFGWMPTMSSASGAFNAGSSKVDTAQLFAEMSGLDFAPGVKFWGGKRYQRYNVHTVDTFYINYGNDVGVGAYDIDLGGAKLGVHAYGSSDFTNKDGKTDTANRLTFDLADIATGEKGKLRFVGSVVNGKFAQGSSGTALSMMHDQADAFGKGVGNRLFLQAAQGYASLGTGFSLGSKQDGVRLVDAVTWQVGAFGGQAHGNVERTKKYSEADNSSYNVTRTSLGVTSSYAFSRNFKLLGEVATTSAKQDNVAGTGRLNKVTIAPTLSLGQDFFSRPELRFYVTHMTWNDAAYHIDGSTMSGFADQTKKSTTLVGAQVEVWF